MSAWCIFSSLGFYPVTPGSNKYAIGSPLIEETTIKLDNGKK
jgi:putative alpha-1,2-mannosidase